MAKKKNFRKNDYIYKRLKLPMRPGKPRKKGITAIIDMETDIMGWMGLRGAVDLLMVAGEYIDFAKIQTHHCLMLPHDYIKHKIKIYREYDVIPFIGGILYELAHHQNATEELIIHLKRIGAPALEISENYITLTRDQLLNELERFKKKGFNVIYEFGRKHSQEPLSLANLESVVEDCLNAGVDHIIIEQDEIDLLSEKDPQTLENIIQKSWFEKLVLEPDPLCFPPSTCKNDRSMGRRYQFLQHNSRPGDPFGGF
jgi:phosphosulfolactate synthase